MRKGYASGLLVGVIAVALLAATPARAPPRLRTHERLTYGTCCRNGVDRPRIGIDPSFEAARRRMWERTSPYDVLRTPDRPYHLFRIPDNSLGGAGEGD